MTDNQIRAAPHQKQWQNKDGPAMYDGGTELTDLKIDEEAGIVERIPCPQYWPMVPCRVTCTRCGLTEATKIA